MKLILFGANGQIGREIKVLAGKFKFDLYAYTRHELDIVQYDCIEAVLKTIKPHCIINAAAYTAVSKAEIEKKAAFLTNAIAVHNLAGLAKKFNIPLLHLSTDYVFDGSKKTAYVEEDFPNPLSVYGMSKLAGENFIREIWYKHIILRVSWVFSHYGSNFVKNILHSGKKKVELKVICDQIGSPSYAEDIAETLLNIAGLIQKGCQAWGTYHFTGMPVTNWHTFACLIIKNAKSSHNLVTNKIQPIYSKDYSTTILRPQNSQLNCYKINKIFKIKQKNWLIGLIKVIKKLL